MQKDWFFSQNDTIKFHTGGKTQMRAGVTTTGLSWFGDDSYPTMSCLHKRPKRTQSEEQAFQEQERKVAKENGKRLGFEGDADLQFLLVGGKLIKIRSNSWKKRRFFKLQDDYKTFCHESHKAFRRNQTFSIDDIDSVRKGRQSEGLNKYTDPSVDEQCFSIIFKGRKKNLDLMASDEVVAKKWVNGLEKILSNMSNLSSQQKSEQYP
ncbi:hypothetical protein L3Q82_004629 [Scortum barcoo]|uniref:Uncharacterized protein n=1 Tax=Scortum barcoo TaxID=214431 RepID=A0ACB8VH86_9TELE|nr:hypothetical protein L3Q82_004629 [Scortum barcoo]